MNFAAKKEIELLFLELEETMKFDDSVWNSVKWPKKVTELHVHLGGSVPLYRLWEMGVERGVRGIGADYEDFINVLKIHPDKVKDLDSYLEVYDKIELIQSGPESVRKSILIAVHGAYRTAGMKSLGPGGEGGDPNPLFTIGKMELRFNPLKRTGAVFLKGSHAGLYDVDRVIKSACSAVEELEIGFKGKIKLGLLFCFGRDMTFEANMALARKVADWQTKSAKIVGVDLAGPESVNPLSDPIRLKEMTEVFKTVGNRIGKTIHVGETSHTSLDTFIKTVEAIQPQRIAHPIVAVREFWERKDDRGLKLIKERDLVCELCLKSNLLTGAVKTVQEYGRVISTLDDFGIRYTFSTDAPALQVTSLAEELILLLGNKAASNEQILRALDVAEKATFIRD